MTPFTRTRLLLLVTLAAVAVVAPASASDRYDDLTPGSVHAEPIGELADAGITLGCAPGRFCPGDEVQRDQMASFLSRSVSRATSASNVAVLDEDSGFDGVPVSVPVRATGAEGGSGWVTLTGVVSLIAEGDVSSCPCEVEAFVYRDSDDAQGPSTWTQLPGETTGSGRAVTSLPVHWTVQIPSGSEETFHVAVFLNDGAPEDLTAEGTLSAVTTPLP